MRLVRDRHQGGFCPSAPPIQKTPSVARKPLRRLARCEGGLLTPIGRLTARPITRFPIASQQQILSPLVLWPFRKHQAISGPDLRGRQQVHGEGTSSLRRPPSSPTSRTSPWRRNKFIETAADKFQPPRLVRLWGVSAETVSTASHHPFKARRPTMNQPPPI